MTDTLHELELWAKVRRENTVDVYGATFSDGDGDIDWSRVLVHHSRGVPRSIYRLTGDTRYHELVGNLKAASAATLLYGPVGMGKTTAVLTACVDTLRFPYVVSPPDLTDNAYVRVLSWLVHNDKAEVVLVVVDAHLLGNEHLAGLGKLRGSRPGMTMVGVASSLTRDIDILNGLFIMPISFCRAGTHNLSRLLSAEVDRLRRQCSGMCEVTKDHTSAVDVLLQDHAKALDVLMDRMSIALVLSAWDSATKLVLESLAGFEVLLDGGEAYLHKAAATTHHTVHTCIVDGVSDLLLVALLQTLVHSPVHDTTPFEDQHGSGNPRKPK